MKKSKEYEMGYDYGLNGPNTTNCDYRLFSTSGQLTDWEQGVKDAKNGKSKTTD